MTAGNFANLITQAAPTALLALGLVFVLLLGEIDLSAATGSGISAALMAVALNHGGDIRNQLGIGTFIAVLALICAAAVVTVASRLWLAAVLIATTGILIGFGLVGSAAAAVIVVAGVGTAVGTLTGFLVARVGIPSFVVTLALFLAWQGALLQIVGQGNAIATQQIDFLNALSNKNLPPAWGWVLLIVAVGIYSAGLLSRSVGHRRRGLPTKRPTIVLLQATLVLVVAVAALLVLNQERGRHPDVVSVRGVPIVVPIVLALAGLLTVVLRRTSFGRHLYAVGGSSEAARRAGIDVTRMRVAAFAICSLMAALGGVLLTSRIGGVPADFGGGNTLLYAVGAAVIGGVSLFGGRGRVRDAIVGAFVVAIIPNGLGLLSVNSSYNFMITGGVLLVAAGIDAVSRSRARKAGNR
ncbi:ABC transporter permease [Nocardia sp. NPDC051463]|uniref:sugar ABC transporter permease n=1 Tax=Nocardia sp. NPDC051463 TaxID=3154845 RepID=UPI003450B397